MKKKLFHLTNALLTTSLVLPTTLAFSSCQSNAEIKSIVLSSKVDYVFHGGSLKINKTILPRSRSGASLLWNIDGAVEGIDVTQKGVVTVSPDLDLKHPIKVLVTASDPLNPSVNASIPITVAPNTTSNLLGFVDGCVSGYDDQGKPVRVPIKRDEKDIYHYEMEHELDIFNQASIYESLFSFDPVFRYRQSHNIKFSIDGGETDSGIQWIGYTDGAWVDSNNIPSFVIVNAGDHTIKINVDFECDERIRLVLKLNLWLRNATAGFFVSYEKQGSSDKHNIQPSTIAGEYNIFLNRDKKTTDKSFDSIGTLYVFRPAYQYLSINFRIAGYEESEAFRYIKNNVSWSTKIVHRPYDNLPYYEITFDTFDFPNDIFDDLFVDSSDPYRLFELAAEDQTGKYIGRLQFYLKP